jgi:uncharacterized protein YceK
MNKILLALLVLFSLSGCASMKEAICGKEDIVVPENKKIHVDPKLLEACKPLLTMTQPTPTWEDYLLLTGDNAILYAECRKKQDSSIKFLKELSNAKE